jgi:hypothetical protein
LINGLPSPPTGPPPNDQNSTPTEYIQPSIERILPDRWRAKKPYAALVPKSATLLVCLKSPLDVGDGNEELEKPHRLAVNSESLLKTLSEITGEILTPSRNVIVYPFKILVLKEEAIRTALADAVKTLEEKRENDGIVSGGTDEEPKHTKGKKDSEGQEDEIVLQKRRDELECLVEFMDNDMADIFAVRKKVQDGILKTIAFEYLWHLFEPGDIILQRPKATQKQQLQAFTVIHVTGGRISFDPGRRLFRKENKDLYEEDEGLEKYNSMLLQSASRITPFCVDCVYTDCDGQVIGPVCRRFVIVPYVGEMAIESLEIYPAKFDSNYSSIMESLLNRGQSFLSAIGGSHKWYSGMAFRQDRLSGPPGSFSDASFRPEVAS